MKKLFAGSLLGVLLLFAGSANAEIDAAKAETFVKEVTTEGIEQIINANIPQAEKDARLQSFLTRLWIWILSASLFWGATGVQPLRHKGKSSSRFTASSTSAPGLSVLTSLRAESLFSREHPRQILPDRFL